MLLTEALSCLMTAMLLSNNFLGCSNLLLLKCWKNFRTPFLPPFPVQKGLLPFEPEYSCSFHLCPHEKSGNPKRYANRLYTRGSFCHFCGKLCYNIHTALVFDPAVFVPVRGGLKEITRKWEYVWEVNHLHQRR